MSPRTAFLCAVALSLTATGALAQGPRAKPKARLAPAPAPLFLPPAPLLGGSDSCSTPDPISGTGLFPFDDTTATTGPEAQSEFLCNQFGSSAILRDVWFSWTAPGTGIARISTVNQTIVDTKLAAYPGGACPTPGTAIACNDDDQASFTYQSTITFRCTSGNVYLLQLGLFPGPFPPAVPGIGNLDITVNSSPANDSCTSAQLVAGFGPGAPHAFDTTLATTGPEGQNNTACDIFATSAIDADVWFEWTAPADGWVCVATCAGAIGDTKIAVYSGAGCPIGQALVCDDDGCGLSGGASEARFFAGSGATYTIQLGSFPGQPGENGVFTIESFTPAAGDDCNAPLLIAGRGPHLFDNRPSTTGIEGQADLLCTTPIDPNPRITYDLWYAWTAPGTGTAIWSMCASPMDSKLAVYAGSACPGASPIACTDSGCAPLGPAALAFPVTAGAPYLLQLGAWPGAITAQGIFTIELPGNTGTAFCFGAGAGTTCPCSPAPIAPGVASNGCPNSIYPGGANLRAEGIASVANDTLVLTGTGMPNGSCLYFTGTTQQSGGAGIPFGDGLFCAGGVVLRAGVKFNNNGSSSNPSGGSPSMSVVGVVPPTGGERTYQIWYRNAQVYCTAATFNLTNGVSVTWIP